MHDLCIFCFFGQKSFLTKNYFLTAEVNLTTRGPLYTCLVLSCREISTVIQGIQHAYAETGLKMHFYEKRLAKMNLMVKIYCIFKQQYFRK